MRVTEIMLSSEDFVSQEQQYSYKHYKSNPRGVFEVQRGHLNWLVGLC